MNIASYLLICLCHFVSVGRPGRARLLLCNHPCDPLFWGLPCCAHRQVMAEYLNSAIHLTGQSSLRELLDVCNVYIIINYTLQLLVTGLSGGSGLPVARNKSSLPVQRRTRIFVPPTLTCSDSLVNVIGCTARSMNWYGIVKHVLPFKTNISQL